MVVRSGTECAYPTGMVLSTIRIQPSPLQRIRALEILRSVQGPTQACPGCVACRIYAEDDADEAILFCESWETETALEEHVRSDLYRRVLAALELSDRAPEVCFHHVASTQGIELIRHLRGVGHSDLTAN